MAHDLTSRLRASIARHEAARPPASASSSAPSDDGRPPKPQSGLMRAADAVAAEIQATTMRLAELARLMRQGSHRTGGSARVSSLTSTIKSDVLRLTKTLDTMEQAAAEKRRAAAASGGLWGSGGGGASRGKAEAAHGEAVVGNLKHSLLGATQGLQSLLSTQTTDLQAAAVRRGRIGMRPPSAVAVPAGAPVAATAGAASAARGRSTAAAASSGAAAPRLDGGDLDDEFGAVDAEALGPSAAAVAQAEARTREMQEVERSTAEVAELFKRLTGILGSQSERIHGVEATLDDSVRSLEQGEAHLSRANATAGSSVLLGMQVSAVLLLAVIAFLLMG